MDAPQLTRRTTGLKRPREQRPAAVLQRQLDDIEFELREAERKARFEIRRYQPPPPSGLEIMVRLTVLALLVGSAAVAAHVLG